ncbi:MAG: NUDIX domain-containing protein [Candidatus Saccharimonadales bacterium]
MSHIHNDSGQHDHTASMYIIRTDFDEPKMMLHLHKKFHMYLQFGGHIELNENPTETIIHELREETGYELEQLKIMQPDDRMTQLHGAVLHPTAVVHSTHQAGESHFHTDVGYAFVTDQPPLNEPDEGESLDIELFTRDEIAELPKDKIYENAREICLYIFDHTLKDWQPVPTSTLLDV